MTLMKSAMISLVFVSSTTCIAAPDAAMQADNQAVNSACASDAQTAGCGGEVVGKGLLKCLWGYKKAHKDYKFSDACHAAIQKHHQDKKAGK